MGEGGWEAQGSLHPAKKGRMKPNHRGILNPANRLDLGPRADSSFSAQIGYALELIRFAYVMLLKVDII